MTMRPFTDARGGLNHLVDAQIGRAFPVVHKVYQHLDAIEYVAKVYEDGRARDIVLRTNHTKEWIEWQYKGEAKWTILFKFSDLLGADIADVVAAEQAIAAKLAQLRQQLAADVETVTEARTAAAEARLGAEAARDAASESQAAAAQSQTAAGGFADAASASATAAALSESTAASHLADLTDVATTTEAAAAASAQHLSAIESQVVAAGLLREQTETASQAAVDAQAAAEVAANAAEQSATAAASHQATTQAHATAAEAAVATVTAGVAEVAASTTTATEAATQASNARDTAVSSAVTATEQAATANASRAAAELAAATASVAQLSSGNFLTEVEQFRDLTQVLRNEAETFRDESLTYRNQAEQMQIDAQVVAASASTATVKAGEAASSAASATAASTAAVATHEAAANPHPQYQVDLVSGTNIKTINGQSILGAGNIETWVGVVPARKHLLVYYGYPVAFKGIWDAAAVAAEIAANYDYWVVGDTYQDPAHAEYASTVSIVNVVRAAGCKVYGYVPTGQNTSGLSLAQMQVRVDQWDTIGVDGVFLDEFGFDYGNTRTRQKSIVDYVYGKGLPYCANAWTAEDFMCDNVNELPWPSNDWRYVNFATGNPTNLVLPRTPADCYLIENFGFSHTGPMNIFAMQERCKLTMALAASKNVGVWGLAVLPETAPGVLDATLLGNLTTLENVGAYISANAYLYDIVVVGSGGFSFGSNGTPLLAPLQALPEYAGAPLSAAVNNYTTMTAVRQFGDVQILVTNTASVQSVSVSSPLAAVLSGEYPTPANFGNALDGGPTLQGDPAPYVTQTKTYQITNYNSFSSYMVSASAGTVSIAGDTITFTAPASADNVSLTLTVDGQPTVFTITVLAVPAYIPVPTATPANFGDPLDGGFYAGMIWNELVQSATSATIRTGVKTFTVPDMTAAPIVYAGQQLEVRSRANPANKFVGTVTDANGTNLTIDVTSIGGSGTFSDWSVMTRHRVIVAPKASGEHANIALKNANTALPTACQTLTEGLAATQAMRDADTSTVYPAAHWARSLNIGGRTDWYIPARDELELCWRNLKPTTAANYANANRPAASGVNYANNGSYGDTASTHGTNNNSSPTGAAYTASVPGQTAATAFRTGGAEAYEFGSAQYWSSSDYGASHAWLQSWVSSFPGNHRDYGKSATNRVRAVRRSVI